MKIQELLESVDTTSIDSDNIKSMREDIDHCAKLIFGIHAGPVKDSKRSKEAIFFGVAHQKSNLADSRGKSVYLTFDNSTDTKEFEINSLVPLLIERGTPEDREILALFRKYDIKSKKKTSYIAHGDQIVLREVNVGKQITSNTVKFVKALMRVLSHQPAEETKDDSKKKEDPKPAQKKEDPKPAPKEVKKVIKKE
jgi:hypothetical protein